MRAALIKRRIARLLVAVMLITMTAQPFTYNNIYADEISDNTATEAEAIESESVEDSSLLTGEEAAGDVVENGENIPVEAETAETETEEAAGDVNTYTVNYYKLDGTTLQTTTVSQGDTFEKINEPANPTKGDYNEAGTKVFKGWVEDSAASTTVFTITKSEQITKNYHFFQYWNDLCTVEFNSEGGSTVSSQTVEKNVGKVNKPENPTRENYKFLNWYTDSDYTHIYTFGGTTDESLTLYAKWIPVYTVYFNVNGGQTLASDMAVQKIVSGQLATEPEPTKPGNICIGWYTSSDIKWDFSDPINKNMTLTAKWVKSQYTVSFSSSGEIIKTISVDYAAKLTEPDTPSKNGAVFDGWYKSDNTKWNFSSMSVVEDMVLTARFTDISYTVLYEKTLTGVVNNMPGQGTVKLDSKIDKPSKDPDNTTYNFTGWYSDEACTEKWDFEKSVSQADSKDGSNIYLYAGWEIKKYTVSFSVNTVDIPCPSPVTVEINGTVTEPTLDDREGYLLKGWYSNIELSAEYKFETKVTSNFTLYADWYQANTVSFNTNSGNKINPIKVVSGNKLKESDLPDASRSGYTFIGWYEDAELTKEWDFDTVITEDTTLHAKWEINKYNVTFYNGNIVFKTIEVTYDKKVPKPSEIPEKTGHTFKDWYKEATCSTIWDFDTLKMPAEDISLYAGYDVIHYTVSFDSMSSDTANPPSQNRPYGDMISAPQITRTGFVLDGWYKNKSFTQSYKWDFDNDKITSDMWLYAKWSYQTFSVTFDSNGGSSIATRYVSYGGKVTKPTDPTKSGYRFKEWCSDAALSVPYDFDDEVKSNLTLYASWETAPTYTVKAYSADSNGSISPSGSIPLKEGVSQKFTFTPKTGYEPYLLKVDGVETDFSGNYFTLENVSKNHIVAISFRKIPVVSYIISANCNNSYGMISPSGEVPVVEGNDKTFYFEAIDGYELDYIEIDGAKVAISSDSYTFENVTKGHTITAYFKEYVEPTPPGYADVIFLVDGEEYNKETVSIGQTVKRPEDPQKSGSIFMGWYKGNWKWNFSDGVEDSMTLTAMFISQTVSDGDVHSGLDTEMNLSDPDDITMVKGQTYTFGAGEWYSSDKSIISIVKKTGKAKAKNASKVAVTLTDMSTRPYTKYNVKVVAPVLSSKKLTLGVGGSETLSLLYAGGLNVAWASSNPKVALVDDGKVTAIAKGSAKITAYVNGKGYSCSVKVSDTYPVPTTFDGVYSITLRPSQTVNLSKIMVNGVKPNKLDWRLSDESGTKDVGKTGWLAWDDGIVRINVNGKLTAKTCGSSVIVGKSGDTRVKTVIVTVATIPTKTETYINVGKSEKLTYYKVNNKKANWTVTNEGDIIQLGSTSATKGAVYGLDVGSAEVYCDYKGLYYQTKVHVENPAVNTEDSRIGTTGNNKYMLIMQNGTRFVIDTPDVTQPVLWKSANKKVAFVDENGIIEARKAGSTTVSAKINGTKVKIKVYVTE